MYELARAMVLRCQYAAHAVYWTLSSERSFHEIQSGDSLGLHNDISKFMPLLATFLDRFGLNLANVVWT